MAKMLGHGFCAGTDMQFFVDVPDVRMHRGVAHLHLVGDFLVEKTFCQQIQNLRFARRQPAARTDIRAAEVSDGGNLW